MAVCRFCESSDGSPCRRCLERLRSHGELRADTTVRRQRILDLQVGRYCGAELVLSFIAAACSHFDLGYALLGDYEEIRSDNGNEHPRLHGPWDAIDSGGRDYRGIGAGGEFGPGRVVATIRFVPVQPGPPWPLLPAPGRLELAALGAGGVLFEVEVSVPPPARWEVWRAGT